MEALSVILVIFAVISSLSKAAQRKNGKAQQRVRLQRAQQAAEARAAKPAKAASPAPAAQSVREHQTLQPTVSVTPHTEETFLGSLGEDSLEGVDPCHEDELAPAEYPCKASPENSKGASARAQAAAQPSGLNLRWSGDEMLRAVVMSEILTRPCDRRRR